MSPDGSRLAVGAGFGKPVAVFATGTLGTPDDPTDLTQATFEYCRAYKFAERPLAFTHHESLVEQAVQRGAPHVR